MLSLFVMVGLLSAVSTFGIGRWKQLGALRVLLLIVGPIIDAYIAYYFLHWISVSGATLWAGSLALGLMSHVLLQPLLVPQRLVVWRLATKNIVRRKRQAALLMVGLIVASAIITSSMIVGDSLDATVRNEVEGAWGQTDITVSGFDLSKGERVTLSEVLANEVWDGIQSNGILASSVEAQQQGIVASVSTSSSESSLTGVTWMAMNSSIDSLEYWPKIGTSADGIRYSTLNEANFFSQNYQVAVNQVLADELNLSKGDRFDLGWYVTDDGQRKRIDAQVEVHSVVANQGQGASAGTQAPALFTDLETAQSMQKMVGRINTIYYGVDDKHEQSEQIQPVLDELQTVLDQYIRSEDVGLSLDLDASSNSLTLSSSQGLGRLSGELVRCLRENMTALSPNASMMEVLQVQMVEMEHENQQILTLADYEITELWSGQRGLWHFTPSGAGFQIEGDGAAWVWRVTGSGIANDFTLDHTGQYGLIATDGELIVGYEGELDDDEWASYSSTGNFLSVAQASEGWWALEENNASLILHSFNLDLSLHDSTVLNLDLPSTILSTQLLSG